MGCHTKKQNLNLNKENIFNKNYIFAQSIKIPMATYKKRGNKVKKGQQTSIEEKSTTAEVFNTLDETASRSEQWVERNQKIIFSGLIAVAVIIIAFLAYNRYVVEPKEKEAADELSYPKRFFEQAQNNNASVDSLYNLSLNGADGKYGLLDIAENYGNTKAGNLAKYMSGIAYLRTGDYENAIEYLSDFKSDDEILASLALGNIGDAFAEINQPEDALEYYVKAAEVKDNDFTTPLYLYKAGQVAMELQKFDKAEDYFTRIKDSYSKSEEAKNIDIYIQRAQLAK